MEYLDCGCLCSGDECAVPCSDHCCPEPEKPKAKGPAKADADKDSDDD